MSCFAGCGPHVWRTQQLQTEQSCANLRSLVEGRSEGVRHMGVAKVLITIITIALTSTIVTFVSCVIVFCKCMYRFCDFTVYYYIACIIWFQGCEASFHRCSHYLPCGKRRCTRCGCRMPGTRIWMYEQGVALGFRV